MSSNLPATTDQSAPLVEADAEHRHEVRPTGQNVAAGLVPFAVVTFLVVAFVVAAWTLIAAAAAQG